MKRLIKASLIGFCLIIIIGCDRSDTVGTVRNETVKAQLCLPGEECLTGSYIEEEG